MPSQSQQEISQREADLAVVRAVVAILPGNWTQAELEVTQTFGTEQSVTIKHVIRNPEGVAGSPEPSEDLYQATRQLTIVLRQSGHKLSRANYSLRLHADQNWNFRATYEYY